MSVLIETLGVFLADSVLSSCACTFLISARRRYAQLGEISTCLTIMSGKWSKSMALGPTRVATVTVESTVALNASE